MAERPPTQQEPTPLKHLWEFDHPYYCSESEFHTGNMKGENWGRTDVESWAEFMEGFGVSDPDLNLVFRWDWRKCDPEDLEENEPPYDCLSLFIMLQRKGLFVPVEVKVTEADEPAVRAWLAERAQTLRATWAPLLSDEDCGE